MGEQASRQIDVSDEGLYQHIVGNGECEEGWCSGRYGNYPREHEGCGGLFHADFGDENGDGDYWLYTKCDRCGEADP